MVTEADETTFLESLRNATGPIEVVLQQVPHLPRTVLLAMESYDGRLQFKTSSRRLWLYLQLLGFNARWTHLSLPVRMAKKIRVIGIGGSAGSIDWLRQVLPQLPRHQVAIFLFLHQQPSHTSGLSGILQADAAYRVVTPTSGTLVENGNIYVAPPDYHMVINGGIIYLTKGEKVNNARPSIEVGMNSLAYEYLDNLLALFITGYGQDGADSTETLRRCDSLIWVEDPKTATAASLPQSVLDQNRCDRVINLQGAAQALDQAMGEDDPDAVISGLEPFLDSINQVYGYDFRGYDPRSMSRRIKLSMGRNGFTDLGRFTQELLSKDVLFQDFFDDASVNVTAYFREPENLKALKDKVFPYLGTYSHCKIWCAACATGEEPYSLAILLYEAGLLEKTQIYATDFNETVLAQAQNGLLPGDSLSTFKDNYFKAGGTKNPEDYLVKHQGFYELVPHIRKKILFFPHNLVSDSAMNEFNLILLRNVMIYFTPELQTKVLSLMSGSLVRGGYLLLGRSESIKKGQETGFSPLIAENKIFKQR